MRVIIAGSRDFDDFSLMTKKCDRILYNTNSVEIVSGTARGADRLGEQYANLRGYPIKRFPADWNTHGKAAGHIRNTQMAEYADALIVFWNGESPGTKNMINTARALGLKVRVVKTNKPL